MDGDWYLSGCRRDDPRRLKSPAEVIDYVHEAGFLPLFSVGIPGFSLEERTPARDWWTDDPVRDPWMWRWIIAEDESVAYGKFFDRKAGFVAREWFPAFANYRRDGYDFEGFYADGKMDGRGKRILDALNLNEEAVGLEMMSGQLRAQANVEKGFDGALIHLQMQSFLLISRFQQKRNKKGEEYGWHLPSFMTPETKWGYDFVNSAEESPEQSFAMMTKQISRLNPGADEKTVRRIMK